MTPPCSSDGQKYTSRGSALCPNQSSPSPAMLQRSPSRSRDRGLVSCPLCPCLALRCGSSETRHLQCNLRFSLPGAPWPDLCIQPQLPRLLSIWHFLWALAVSWALASSPCLPWALRARSPHPRTAEVGDRSQHLRNLGQESQGEGEGQSHLRYERYNSVIQHGKIRIFLSHHSHLH